MRVLLDFWNRRWQSVSYDTATGAGRIRWLVRPPKESGGWAYRHRGKWFAVWKDRNRLVFQVGDRQWSLGCETACRLVESGTTRRFTLSRNGIVEFEFEYEPARHEDDPTFDDLDDEMEDFFLWLNRLWGNAERQRSMLRSAS